MLSFLLLSKDAERMCMSPRELYAHTHVDSARIKSSLYASFILFQRSLGLDSNYEADDSFWYNLSLIND